MALKVKNAPTSLLASSSVRTGTESLSGIAEAVAVTCGAADVCVGKTVEVVFALSIDAVESWVDERALLFALVVGPLLETLPLLLLRPRELSLELLAPSAAPASASHSATALARMWRLERRVATRNGKAGYIRYSPPSSAAGSML